MPSTAGEHTGGNKHRGSREQSFSEVPAINASYDEGVEKIRIRGKSISQIQQDTQIHKQI